MALSDAPAAPGAGWDESQCKAGLAQLEGLQEQLDDLRLTIHRVVQPLSAPLTNNPALFEVYKNAVVGSQNNIKSFRTHWKSPDVQNILEHSNNSFAANTDLSPSAQVPRYGWKQNQVTELEPSGRNKDDAQISDDTLGNLDKDEIGRLLDAFQKSNPAIQIATKDDNRDLMIQFVTNSMKLKFHVTISPDANAKGKLTAECLGTTKPFTSISNCVVSRSRPNDLKYLLDMIAAYKTVKGTTCAKCSKMLDQSVQMPTARRSKQVTADDGSQQVKWEPFHEGCIEGDS
ncbi:hypothetical protein K491DRAFT_589145 [Lophiostoma macrostomum CBS 122681]|uniref:Mediator complex subunit 27 n=1 Tax=Lophiostoma macrostomum CBS 122681 TaxID=1314788 RepID=A0A6A6TMI1_9PLEO|nr:hypothetical protein K491DRAFT_589145 [Lophiostoma macrostomum CBS 122681]